MKRTAVLINKLKYDKSISLNNLKLKELPDNGLLTFKLETNNIYYGKASINIEKGNFVQEDFVKIEDEMAYDEYTIVVEDISKEQYLNKIDQKDIATCRLLGYAIEIQDSVILEALVNNFNYDINLALEHVKDYRLLAQFKGDLFGFASDSLISFIIKNSDLANLDFSNVVYEVQM